MTVDEIKYAIIEAARRNGANALQSLAQAKAESNFNQSAISPVGAIGVFQLMPGTAAELGVNPYDALQNIDLRQALEDIADILEEVGLLEPSEGVVQEDEEEPEVIIINPDPKSTASKSDSLPEDQK